MKPEELSLDENENKTNSFSQEEELDNNSSFGEEEYSDSTGEEEYSDSEEEQIPDPQMSQPRQFGKQFKPGINPVEKLNRNRNLNQAAKNETKPNETKEEDNNESDLPKDNDLNKNNDNPLKKETKKIEKNIKKELFVHIITNPIFWIVLAVFGLVLVLMIITVFTQDLAFFPNAHASRTSDLGMWWPIGSLEPTEDNIYGGYPAALVITSGYEMRDIDGDGIPYHHGAIDIGAARNTPIIAALDGVVTISKDGCVEGQDCGHYCGNYVKINHENGYETMYCHNTSNTVEVGDEVKKGQLIAYAGNTGNSFGSHLHFAVYLNGQHVNPLNYIDPNNNRPEALEFNIKKTYMSYEEFASKALEYTRNSEFVEYIHPNLEEIYSASLTYGVNPELVVVRAVKEGFSPGGNTNNWWGINCTNTGGGADCIQYSSITKGIESFANIVSRSNTIEEMMSSYAYIGSSWYNPGSPSVGGCYYYPYIQQYMTDLRSNQVSNYCSPLAGQCSVSNTAACNSTTTEDQEAYTAWQVEGMLDLRRAIFG